MNLNTLLRHEVFGNGRTDREMLDYVAGRIADASLRTRRVRQPGGDADAIVWRLNEVRCEAERGYYNSVLLGLLRFLDRLVDLPAMNRHLFGRFNAQSNLAATYFDDGDDDVLVDDDALVLLSG
jgi:hypothetical protein